MTIFATSIPGMPLLPPGAPGGPSGVAGAAGGSPIPGLPSLPPMLTALRFVSTSRYAGIEIVAHVGSLGQPHPYLRRRFVPDPSTLGEIDRYTVEEGDRIDRIAAAVLGDPEQFWRLCDANRASDPVKLETTIGRVLRVTLPAGIPVTPAHG